MLNYGRNEVAPPKLLLLLYTLYSSTLCWSRYTTVLSVLHIPNVIWFEHESLIVYFNVCLSFLKIQMITQFIPLSQNNWWNSSWKRRNSTTSTTTYGWRGWYYFIYINYFDFTEFIPNTCKYTHARAAHWEIHWKNDWSIRYLFCTIEKMLTYFPNDKYDSN